METRPPEVIERAVQWLLPPASREHVLGDLRERYVSPRQYLRDVARTLPFVVASRMRRTTNPWFSALIAVLIFTTTWVGQGAWIAPIISSAVAAVALAFRDAYRTPVTKALHAAAIDTAWVALGILLSQGFLAVTLPDLVLKRDAFFALSAGLLLLFLVRLQAGFPAVMAAASRMSRQELLHEVRQFESSIRRAVRLEWAACAFVAINCAVGAWTSSGITPAVGSALLAAGAVFIGCFLYKNRPRAIPGDLGFDQTVSAYRVHLEKGIELSSTYLWWYLMPMAPGLAVLIFGTRNDAYPVAPWFEALGVLLLGALLLLLQRSGRRKTRRRIDQLAILEEKPAAGNPD